MDAKARKLWVAALRSGKYKQTNDRLRGDKRNDRCCLGVLCDVYRKATGKGKWMIKDPLGINNPRFKAGESVGKLHLPVTVAEWAGLTEVSGDEVTIDDISRDLAGHNDKGPTFDQIADAIHEQL